MEEVLEQSFLTGEFYSLITIPKQYCNLLMLSSKSAK